MFLVFFWLNSHVGSHKQDLGWVVGWTGMCVRPWGRRIGLLISSVAGLPFATVPAPVVWRACPDGQARGETGHRLGMRIDNPECTSSFFPPKHVLYPGEQEAVWAACGDLRQNNYFYKKVDTAFRNVSKWTNRKSRLFFSHFVLIP